MLKFLLQEKLSEGFLVIVLSILALIHACILTDLIPYDMVWGGRLNSRLEAIRFETIALLATLIMLLVVIMRKVYYNRGLNPLVIKVFLWLMTVMFLLNAAGNFASYNVIEKYFFGPITILMFLSCLRLALSKSPDHSVPELN